MMIKSGYSVTIFVFVSVEKDYYQATENKGNKQEKHNTRTVHSQQYAANNL